MATATKSRRRVVVDPTPEEIAAECAVITARRLAEFDERANRREATEKAFRQRRRDQRRAQRKATLSVINDLQHRSPGLARALVLDEAEQSAMTPLAIMYAASDGKRDMTKADICNVDVGSLFALNAIPESDEDFYELGPIDPVTMPLRTVPASRH